MKFLKMKNIVNIHLLIIGIIFIIGCSVSRVDSIKISNEIVKLENVAINQKNILEDPNKNSIRFEYLHYRPVEYEKHKVQENENVHPNKGGLIYVYYKNTLRKNDVYI